MSTHVGLFYALIKESNSFYVYMLSIFIIYIICTAVSFKVFPSFSYVLEASLSKEASSNSSYVHFRNNAREKDMNLLIPSAIGLDSTSTVLQQGELWN